TFIIELIASNGICEDSWFDTITAVPFLPLEYSVPNVFTPNGDGDNDFYGIISQNAISQEAVIIDRWGIKMTELNTPNALWDGTSGGKEATDGVYFITYRIVGPNNIEENGHTFFHLIR
ncbi:MAG: gliding motility-associated C-terminal domain-containing protein, partial [Bacteroidetes bacterium]|nr:gliding motility-associated C-terminal domain-containing protein [Bacteroidota bacterium]